ncbi:MAG TPA: amino acid racemase [Candidatus Polarisedimenticolaceae bacterium]|nr:amino acid racemase [Candidatus Polarisedimenticolaceae bacterium]
MKVIGIVGGIGPESTVDYYRLLLSRFRKAGSHETPGIFINSIDLSRLLSLAGLDDRAGLIEYLLGAVEALARAGTELALFAANTPHLVFDEVQQRSPIELVSIVEATCETAQGMGLKRVGLIGARFTMQGEFYPAAFARRGIAVVVPVAEDQVYVHERYVNELVSGKFLPETRAGFMAVIERMHRRDGIDGVVLGGTELPLLLRDSAHPLPFLDTTQIHVDAVVARALADAAG